MLYTLKLGHLFNQDSLCGPKAWASGVHNLCKPLYACSWDDQCKVFYLRSRVIFLKGFKGIPVSIL